MVQYGISGFQLHVTKWEWLFLLPHFVPPVCREPSANNVSSLLKPQEITGNRSRFPFTILLPPSQNIDSFRLFQSQTFWTLTNNNSKNNLFQIEKVTYLDSSFHDKSTDIIFMLLAFMIISLFMVEVEKVWFWKSLNEAIFRDRGSIILVVLPELCPRNVLTPFPVCRGCKWGTQSTSK
jgi:hypothetical protein